MPTRSRQSNVSYLPSPRFLKNGISPSSCTQSWPYSIWLVTLVSLRAAAARAVRGVDRAGVVLHAVRVDLGVGAAFTREARVAGREVEVRVELRERALGLRALVPGVGEVRGELRADLAALHDARLDDRVGAELLDVVLHRLRDVAGRPVRVVVEVREIEDALLDLRALVDDLAGELALAAAREGARLGEGAAVEILLRREGHLPAADADEELLVLLEAAAQRGLDPAALLLITEAEAERVVDARDLVLGEVLVFFGGGGAVDEGRSSSNGQGSDETKGAEVARGHDGNTFSTLRATPTHIAHTYIARRNRAHVARTFRC